MGLTQPREAEARGRPETGLKASAVTAVPASEDGHEITVAGGACRLQ